MRRDSPTMGHVRGAIAAAERCLSLIRVALSTEGVAADQIQAARDAIAEVDARLVAGKAAVDASATPRVTRLG
jgi:hypothetical protein